MILPPLPAALCDPQVPSIVERFGKRYAPTAIPKGLPRFRAFNRCHRNCQLAAFRDRRLTYVEGLAPVLSTAGTLTLIGRAWLTMDGEHAIDPTWHGQQVRFEGVTYTIDPAADYYGVEIPTEDVARITISNKCHGLILEQWKRGLHENQVQS